MADTPADSFLIAPIARLSAELVVHVSDRPEDINVKIAALRGAADILAQAVSAAHLAALIRQSLAPKT